MCASSGAEQDALRASVALGFLALAAIELGGVAVALAVAPVDQSDSNRWVDEALARELRTLIYTAAAAFVTRRVYIFSGRRCLRETARERRAPDETRPERSVTAAPFFC